MFSRLENAGKRMGRQRCLWCWLEVKTHISEEDECGKEKKLTTQLWLELVTDSRWKKRLIWRESAGWNARKFLGLLQQIWTLYHVKMRLKNKMIEPLERFHLTVRKTSLLINFYFIFGFFCEARKHEDGVQVARSFCVTFQGVFQIQGRSG